METGGSYIHNFGWLFFDIYERKDGQVAVDIEVTVYTNMFI